MKYACEIKSKEKTVSAKGSSWLDWKVEYYPVNQIHNAIVQAANDFNITILGTEGYSHSDTRITYIFKGRRKKVKMLINVLIQAFGDKYYFEKGYSYRY